MDVLSETQTTLIKYRSTQSGLILRDTTLVALFGASKTRHGAKKRSDTQGQ